MAKRRILVVEDEEKVRVALAAFLEPEYDVVQAQDGREAVALAQQTMPNLILLDLRLPRLDGLDALRLLKMSPETVTIPVVVISAIGESDSLMNAEMLGASDYLIKPVNLQEVRDAVQRYLIRWKEDRLPPPEPPLRI